MFEHHHKSLLPRKAFFKRQAAFAALALGLVFGSLGIGILGYRHYENMPWIDAFLNAAMIMGGMGPLGELHTVHGKFFAGFYALYCGMVLLVAVGLLFAPLFHRFLHRFHLELEESSKHGKK